MTEVIRRAGTTSAVDLARRLGKEYFTVARALQRVKRGQLRCALTWNPCTECAHPIAGPSGRTAHPRCEGARRARYQREGRRRRPGQSSPYVARFRRERPERASELREREKARRRELWPDLPERVRMAILARVHAADARDYPATHAKAERSWRNERWTEEEDTYLIDHPGTPAREIALRLGRTLWGVRNRRVRLRRRRGARTSPDDV